MRIKLITKEDDCYILDIGFAYLNYFKEKGRIVSHNIIVGNK